MYVLVIKQKKLSCHKPSLVKNFRCANILNCSININKTKTAVLNE